ncbi:hypothetical protein BU24DRAFT_420653 [Aaosphaeria arxii CBS 175.79]|uniref:Uncharacterized protein n=1 Tax=Aaosphaeria arxii CBS 175.79 TaxID=1450172 RepID=A0A6A5XXI5_9PLEO|nr:uncharacterized protein BU24DRAFT_420653 [Aaosphaeria arxii CBS 175.79]KAF2017613.1 hypothetical protein BU24DRAFT_420653 [Aaosphaeria arxii CBS 175.79]
MLYVQLTRHGIPYGPNIARKRRQRRAPALAPRAESTGMAKPEGKGMVSNLPFGTGVDMRVSGAEPASTSTSQQASKQSKVLGHYTITATTTTTTSSTWDDACTI